MKGKEKENERQRKGLRASPATMVLFITAQKGGLL
jgi:hypothetical protein